MEDIGVAYVRQVVENLLLIILLTIDPQVPWLYRHHYCVHVILVYHYMALLKMLVVFHRLVNAQGLA